MPTHSRNRLDAHRLRKRGAGLLEFCSDTLGFPIPSQDTRQDIRPGLPSQGQPGPGRTKYRDRQGQVGLVQGQARLG